MSVSRQGIETAGLTLLRVDQIAGRKIPLGLLPDGRRLDLFAGAKDGRLYVRVRQAQGATRLYWITGVSG